MYPYCECSVLCWVRSFREAANGTEGKRASNIRHYYKARFVINYKTVPTSLTVSMFRLFLFLLLIIADVLCKRKRSISNARTRTKKWSLLHTCCHNPLHVSIIVLFELHSFPLFLVLAPLLRLLSLLWELTEAEKEVWFTVAHQMVG